MSQHVTISDVAKAAGVSITTVSRYLNGRYQKMSAQTKERIDATIKELHYVPAASARRLRQTQSHLVGVLVGDIANHFSSLLSKGIYDVLQPAGYDVLLMNTNNSQEMEKKALNDLYQQRVDGIIVQPNSRSFDQYQSVLRNQIPLVLVDREVDDQPLTVGKVTSANFDASYRLGRKLGSRGYQNVITVSSRFAEASGQHPRIKGFQLAAAETGLTYRNIEIKGHDDDWLARELTRVMGQLSGRTVVISLMGPTLFTLLKIFKHEKVTFPKDLGLISFDDWSWSQYVGEDGIFLLRQDMELMGNLAAQKLLNQIESHSMISDTSSLPVTIDEHASI